MLAAAPRSCQARRARDTGPGFDVTRSHSEWRAKHASHRLVSAPRLGRRRSRCRRSRPPVDNRVEPEGRGFSGTRVATVPQGEPLPATRFAVAPGLVKAGSPSAGPRGPGVAGRAEPVVERPVAGTGADLRGDHPRRPREPDGRRAARAEGRGATNGICRHRRHHVRLDLDAVTACTRGHTRVPIKPRALHPFWPSRSADVTIAACEQRSQSGSEMPQWGSRRL